MIKFIIFAALVYSLNSMAGCGADENPDDFLKHNKKFDSIEKAQQEIVEKMGYLVSFDKTSSRCSNGSVVTVFDKDMNKIGQFDVSQPKDKFTAEYLYGLMREFNKTPKETHLALQKAQEVMRADMEELEKKFGFDFYVPSAWSPSDRINKGEQTLISSMHRCYPNSEVSSQEMGQIKIPVAEYVLGEKNSEQKMYKAGDLEKQLFKNKDLLHKLVLGSNDNDKNCMREMESCKDVKGKCCEKGSYNCYSSSWYKHRYLDENKKMISEDVDRNKNLREELSKRKFKKFSVHIKSVDNPAYKFALEHDFKKKKLGQDMNCIRLLNSVSSCSVYRSESSDCNPLTGEKTPYFDFDVPVSERKPRITTAIAGDDKDPHMFMLKREFEGYTYIFTDDGIYKVLLDTDTTISKEEMLAFANLERKIESLEKNNGDPEDIAMMKKDLANLEKAKERVYPIKINGKKMALKSYSRLASFEKKEAHYLLGKNKSKKTLQECKEEGSNCYPLQKPKKVSKEEADELLKDIIKHQTEKLVETRELTEHDQSPDCSYWEKVYEACIDQATYSALTTIENQLMEAYTAGKSKGLDYCEKPKNYEKRFKKKHEQYEPKVKRE